MAMLRHPIAKANYVKREDGLVEVTAPDGAVGVFDQHGRWIEGKLRTADAAMCFWLAQVSDAARPANLSRNSK